MQVSTSKVRVSFTNSLPLTPKFLRLHLSYYYRNIFWGDKKSHQAKDRIICLYDTTDNDEHAQDKARTITQTYKALHSQKSVNLRQILDLTDIPGFDEKSYGDLYGKRLILHFVILSKSMFTFFLYVLLLLIKCVWFPL